jgi:hypothetical protein
MLEFPMLYNIRMREGVGDLKKPELKADGKRPIPYILPKVIQYSGSFSAQCS